MSKQPTGKTRTRQGRQPNATDPDTYKRATYYLKPETIKRLKLMAIQQDKAITTFVREILEGYVAKKGK